MLYFTYLPRSPPWTDLHQIWHRVSSPRRNHVCQIFCRSVQGFRFCMGSKFAILHWLSRSPLTQCSRYRAACDIQHLRFWYLLIGAFVHLVDYTLRRHSSLFTASPRPCQKSSCLDVWWHRFLDTFLCIMYCVLISIVYWLFIYYYGRPAYLHKHFDLLVALQFIFLSHVAQLANKLMMMIMMSIIILPFVLALRPEKKIKVTWTW